MSLEARLRALGVHRRPLFALLRAFLLIDIRHQATARARSTPAAATPFALVLWQLMGTSLLASAVLFGRVDVWLFCLITLSLSGTLLGLVLLSEFADILLDTADVHVVGPHPVPARTYTLARALNVAAYTSVLAAGLHLFPCIIGAGLRDAGPWFAPAYALTALVLTAWVLVGVLAISTLALRRRRERLRELLSVMQVVPLLIVFYGGQLLIQDSSHRLQMLAYSPPAWLDYLPTAWLASAVWVASAHPGWPLLVMAAFGLITALLAGATALALLSAASPWEASAADPFVGVLRRARVPAAAVLPQAPALKPFRERTSDRRARRVPTARSAGFALARAMWTRDPDLLARVLPYLGMAAGALVLSYAQGRLADPFVDAGGASAGSFLALYLLVLTAPTIVQSTLFSRDAAAAWVLHAAPVRHPGELVEGAVSAGERYLLDRAFALCAVVLALVWRAPAHAVVHAGVGMLAARFVARLSVGLLVRQYPFARPPARLETLTAHLQAQAVALSIAAALSVVHARACASWPALLGLAAALMAARAALVPWSRRRLAAGFRPDHE